MAVTGVGLSVTGADGVFLAVSGVGLSVNGVGLAVDGVPVACHSQSHTAPRFPDSEGSLKGWRKTWVALGRSGLFWVVLGHSGLSESF